MKSTRIPLWFGVLKIRHREQLLYEERHRLVPVWTIGDYCLIWWANPGRAARNPIATWAGKSKDKAPPKEKPAQEKPRAPVVFMIGQRNGAWTIEFEGEHFGPCTTREEAIDAAYLMAVDAAAKGFDPCVQLEEAGVRPVSGFSRSDSRARAA
jgi:hypothetical protein